MSFEVATKGVGNLDEDLGTGLSEEEESSMASAHQISIVHQQ